MLHRGGNTSLNQRVLLRDQFSKVFPLKKFLFTYLRAEAGRLVGWGGLSSRKTMGTFLCENLILDL